MRLVLLQLSLLGALLLAHGTSPGRVLFRVPPAMQWVAGTLLIVAFALVGAALIAIGRSFRVHPRPRTDGRLVTHGIYARLRHPMYSAAVLACAALVLDSGNLAVAVMALTVVVFYILKARYEERLLVRHYPGYEAYRLRTWGIFPWRPRARSAPARAS
jgi:protein-S-isoprenylcysteine O-methyltransferase Ste14